MSRTPLFLLEALQFQNARKEKLRSASDEEWNRILSDWKYVRLALPVREVAGEELPEWVRERIDQFLEDNGKRFERLKREYARVAETLATGGVEHVVLKGFTLFPGYASHPKNRPQSDIDLYCPPGMIAMAREILLGLGYSMNPHWRRISEEHLSALVPANSWKWKGNHFDPNIPISLELHFTMWNEKGSRLRAEGVEEFWSRRVNRELDGLAFPGLDAVDNLGYTSLNI